MFGGEGGGDGAKGMVFGCEGGGDGAKGVVFGGEGGGGVWWWTQVKLVGGISMLLEDIKQKKKSE